MDQPPTSRPLEQKLAAAWPVDRWQDVTVLMAISGGADSVALLAALATLKSSGRGRLVVGHFNHHWRGDDANADQQFVVELCEKHDLYYEIGHALQSPGGSPSDGLEAAARAERYDFLQLTAERLGARYVVTAHTADDQAETILHHILRGTGLSGLAGIPRQRTLGLAVTLFRPMLEITRAEVLAYLASRRQLFREDLSNAEVQFTRNRIRHELLPLLERDYAPAVTDSLRRLGKLAADAQRVLDAAALDLIEHSVQSQEAERVVIDCPILGGQDRHLVRELLVAIWRRQGWPLQSMGFAQWDLLADMALATGTASISSLEKQTLPGAILAQRQGEQLVLLALC